MGWQLFTYVVQPSSLSEIQGPRSLSLGLSFLLLPFKITNNGNIASMNDTSSRLPACLFLVFQKYHFRTPRNTHHITMFIHIICILVQYTNTDQTTPVLNSDFGLKTVLLTVVQNDDRGIFLTSFCLAL